MAMGELIQWAFNLAFLVVLYSFWRRQQNGFSPSQLIAQNENKMKALMLEWQRKSEVLEKGFLDWKESSHRELKKLMTLCLQAEAIVKQNRESNFSPSIEEKELKEFHSLAKNEIIPTLLTIERTKARLKSETQLDLRTVLKDQLA